MVVEKIAQDFWYREHILLMGHRIQYGFFQVMAKLHYWRWSRFIEQNQERIKVVFGNIA